MKQTVSRSRAIGRSGSESMLLQTERAIGWPTGYDSPGRQSSVSRALPGTPPCKSIAKSVPRDQIQYAVALLRLNHRPFFVNQGSSLRNNSLAVNSVPFYRRSTKSKFVNQVILSRSICLRCNCALKRIWLTLSSGPLRRQKSCSKRYIEMEVEFGPSSS